MDAAAPGTLLVAAVQGDVYPVVELMEAKQRCRCAELLALALALFDVSVHIYIYIYIPLSSASPLTETRQCESWHTGAVFCCICMHGCVSRR